MSTSSANTAYEKDITIIVPVVFAALSTVIYGARLFARQLSASTFGTDDVLMGIGLLISYGATVAIVWTGFNGAGQNSAKLPKPEQLRFNEGAWLLQKFWPTSLAFIKCSIIVFMQRLFHTNKKFILASTTLIVIISLWALTALLVNTFQCWPVQYFYDKSIPGGHCMNGQNNFFETMGSVSLTMDVAILVLPMPIIWHLQMGLRRKIALTVVFSLGSLVCIFSLLRLVYFRQFQTTNLSSSSVLESIFTVLEINMAIICGCLPALQPLFKKAIPKSLTSRSGFSSSGAKTHVSTSSVSRSKRKPMSHEEDGFERIVDYKPPNDMYRQGHDSEQGIEMSGIEVHTDMNQTSGERRAEEQSGVTSLVWPT